MIDLVRRLLVISVVVLAVMAAGCGGSDAEDNTHTASVAEIQSFADQQLQLRLKSNQSADAFTCEEDGDANWKCTTEVTTDNPGADADVAPLTVTVTCDAAATCTYTPET